jgi:ligand-binding sensor domain-containing protein
MSKLDGSSDVVRALFRDREGNIWVGTTRSLDRYSQTIVTSISAPTVGINGGVNAVLAVNHDLWVGTSDGLFRHRPDGWRRYGPDDGLPSATVQSLHLDRSGALLVGTDRGIGQFSRDRFVSHSNAQMMALRRVSTMASDSQGTLWLSDRDSGLFRLTNGVLSAFDGAPDMGQKSALSVYADRRDQIWIGFSDGSLLLVRNGTVQTYRDVGGMLGGVTSIYEDRCGTLWVGTNNGLRRFKDGQFISVPRSAAFPPGAVGVITEDDLGYLWVGVRAGIIRVSATELEAVIANTAHSMSYTLYDQSDGVGGDVAVGARAVTRDRDGTLWFADSHRWYGSKASSPPTGPWRPCPVRVCLTWRRPSESTTRP